MRRELPENRISQVHKMADSIYIDQAELRRQEPPWQKRCAVTEDHGRHRKNDLIQQSMVSECTDTPPPVSHTFLPFAASTIALCTGRISPLTKVMSTPGIGARSRCVKTQRRFPSTSHVIRSR